MICSDMQSLIEEVPPKRWTAQQTTRVHEHCSQCAECHSLLQEQTAVFALLEDMPVPGSEPAIDLSFLQTPRQPHLRGNQSAPVSSLLTTLALLTTIAGGAVLMASGPGITLHWMFDDQRLASIASAIISMPLLSLVTVISAMIYCLNQSASVGD